MLLTNSDATHPSQEQLEAAAFGWIERELAPAIREHAGGCPRCGPLLTAEEAVSQRLAVLRRIEAEGRQPLLRSSRAGSVTLGLLLVSLLAIVLVSRKQPGCRARRRIIP